jgi:hypothetical protein
VPVNSFQSDSGKMLLNMDEAFTVAVLMITSEGTDDK